MPGFGAISERLIDHVEQPLDANPLSQEQGLAAIGSEAEAAGPDLAEEAPPAEVAEAWEAGPTTRPMEAGSLE